MRAVLLLASMLFVSRADDEVFSVDVRSSRSHYCGEDLCNTLKFLCDSIYKHSSTADGRDDSPSQSWMLDVPDKRPEPSDDHPFRSRATALSLTPFYFRRHARQGGVVDECCLMASTINELRSYCGSKQG